MGGFAITSKPGVFAQIRALPKKHRDQVFKKLEMLETDPHPDGDTKKKLTNGAYRLRSGDYRIFYTFNGEAVGIIDVRLRNEKTFGNLPVPEMPAVANLAVDLDTAEISTEAPPVSAREPDGELLPRPIDKDVLKAARVDEAQWPALMAVKTVDELLACEGASTEAILAVVEILLPRSIEERLAEPDIVLAAGTESLSEVVKQDLDVRALLLELDEKQERFVSFALDGAGPVLVRGGPGTGKSTVALYRTKRLVDELTQRAPDLFTDPDYKPRVLFTTYTNALVTFSADLLRHLLGSDVELVEITTTDRVIDRVHRQLTGKSLDRTNPSVILAHLERSRTDLQSADPSDAARARTLERLGVEYIHEEIDQVIYGRGLESFEEYAAAERDGRREGLTRQAGGQRWHIWQIKEQLEQRLGKIRRVTYSQGRAQTAREMRNAVQAGKRSGTDFDFFDAIVVDEAQDLDPVSLAVLIELVPNPNRLFVAADANQAIFRSGFNLSGVHDALDFTGRIGVLDRNFRTTAAIAEAAETYLRNNPNIEVDLDPSEHVHDGPRPRVVDVVGDLQAEALLIASELMDAATELRAPIGSSAVLAPTNADCKELADALTGLGIPARFQDSKGFAPRQNKVKVMPFRACKGLEFPIVVLGGFTSGSYPQIPNEIGDDALEELYERERRQIYVAMTRAMRRLSVIRPAGSEARLLRGFDAELWETKVVR